MIAEVPTDIASELVAEVSSMSSINIMSVGAEIPQLSSFLKTPEPLVIEYFQCVVCQTVANEPRELRCQHLAASHV